MRPTACKSCGASIFFARTAEGKMMPFDAEPEKSGWVVNDDRPGDPTCTIEPVYVPHWITCPTAHVHRRTEKPAKLPGV